MYLLSVDESGKHGRQPRVPFRRPGDPRRRRRPSAAIDSLVIEHLARVPLSLDEYELHAAEMRNAKKPGKQLPAALGGVVVDSRPPGRAPKSPAAAPGRTPD
jgi:hypothetical protein